ncbi:hypothetical protein CC85DRAFT_285219 [Cutaneotrichosporon oleaginosum]|uniref:Uncharacterized protein n=1 Tax=Cutaneotrichosporon oleaginosum TaxID=879819 RepID=A0A0J0XNY8_9TREE|nr:uncharacterized protein CC85DRAFT_285219 [Cutaneotrichosporon oleaginosum]KLT42871.1 hypothetical protein CC85DRAFT_285219 [Cutaneotrichosporon oleaginosum]TXT08164.1 hypothetical protein COLE_05088 [Cutaneotrichosporon oleaginosum]
MLNRHPSPYFPGSESRDDLKSTLAPSPKITRYPGPLTATEPEIKLRPSFSIPMISVTRAETDDGHNYSSSQGGHTSKANEARAAVESVQNVLEENIAGIDESPPSFRSRRRGRPLEPWYRKKWVIIGGASGVIVVAITVLVVVIVVETR